MNTLIKYRDSVSFIIISLFISFLWLSGVWPGYIQSDSLDYILIAKRGSVHDWLSFSMSLLTNVAIAFKEPIGFVSVTFILFFSLMLNCLRKEIDFHFGAQKAWFYCFLVLLNPLILSMNIYYSREVPFAMLGTFLMLLLFRWKYRENKIHSFEFILWVLLLGLFTELRQDARLFIFLYPFIGYFTKIFNFKRLILAMLGGFLVNFLLVFGCTKFYSKMSPLQDKYMITSTYGVLMAQDFLTREDYDDLYPIVRINHVHMQNAEDKYTYLLRNTEIGSPQELKVYYSRIFILLKRNPWGFLKSRIQFFLKSLNVMEVNTEWYNDFLDRDHETISPEYKNLNYKKKPIFEYVNQLHSKFEFNLLWNGDLKRVLFSGLLPLFFSIILLFSWKFTPLSSFFGVIFLIKFSINLLLAPIIFANYYYFCYLGAIILLPLTLGELKQNQFIKAFNNNSFYQYFSLQIKKSTLATRSFFQKSKAILTDTTIGYKAFGCTSVSFIILGLISTLGWKQVYFDNAQLVMRILSEKQWVFGEGLLQKTIVLIQTPSVVSSFLRFDANFTIWLFCFSIFILPVLALLSCFLYLKKFNKVEFFFILLLNFSLFVLPVWGNLSFSYWLAIVFSWPFIAYTVVNDSPRLSIVLAFCTLMLFTHEMTFFIFLSVLFIMWRKNNLSWQIGSVLMLSILFQVTILWLGTKETKINFETVLNNNPPLYLLLSLLFLYLRICFSSQLLKRLFLFGMLLFLFIGYHQSLTHSLNFLWSLNYRNQLIAIPLSAIFISMGYDFLYRTKIEIDGIRIFSVILFSIPTFIIDSRMNIDALKVSNNLSLFMKIKKGCNVLSNTEKLWLADKSFLPDWNLPYLTVLMNQSRIVRTIYFNSKTADRNSRCYLSSDKHYVYASPSEFAHLHDWTAYDFYELRKDISGFSDEFKNPLQEIKEIGSEKLSLKTFQI